MNIYSGLFPLIYDHYWPAFGRSAAPLIFDYYAQTRAGKSGLPVLDLCCGTGDLAAFFLERNVPVTGLDISPDMLALAREKNAPYVERGTANFITADACDFQLETEFGLVVSTYDSFNHLPTLTHVKNALRCAVRALHPEGVLIFDMNTEQGLRQFTNIQVMDQRDVLIISRSIFDARNACSLMEITGFLKSGDGSYQRFDQSLVNFVYNLREIGSFLRHLGLAEVRFTRVDNLSRAIANPEEEERIFFVAHKSRPAL